MFRKRKCGRSEVAERRLEKARRDLEEQKRKYDRAVQQQQDMQEALERNHIAELMYEALSGRRQGE